LRLAFPLLAAAALVATGCGSGSVSTGSTQTGSSTGPAFVIGTDAPLASVASFSVQIESLDAIDANGNKVSLISGTPTVDFARFNGLQTLLDMNDVTGGTYTSVSITLGTGTIGYLQTGSGAPTIQTMAATYSNPTVNIALDKPLVVQQGGAPVGLRMDFDLRQSIGVDSNGNITGAVTPTFDVKAVTNSDSGAYIDEFVAAVVSVGTQSFVVQGPHGEQFTINVDGQTDWDNNESISDLTTSSIVQISGQLDTADQTLDADEVAILSQNGFYAGGLVTYLQPATATTQESFQLYVRGLLPTTTGLTLGQIATVDLSGSENFFIYWMHNPLTQFLFNANTLLAGQHVTVGGPASGAANASDVTVNRVMLRHWGYNGTVVAGSEDSSTNSFQMQVGGFAGVLIPETVTVYVGGKTGYRSGFGEFSDIADGDKVRVVGLLLKDPTSGNAVLLARYVDDMD
jgi:hypothetical protein